MGAKLLIGTPCMRNELVLNKTLLNVMRKSMVLIATPNMILQKGVGLQIQSYLGFYLVLSTKID